MSETITVVFTGPPLRTETYSSCQGYERVGNVVKFTGKLGTADPANHELNWDRIESISRK